MRAPVYRNLDTPFRILGFSPLELGVLCFVFVGGGELAQALSIGRVWSLVAAALLALGLFTFRRSFGEHFAARLYRFSRLPARLPARLLPKGLHR